MLLLFLTAALAASISTIYLSFHTTGCSNLSLKNTFILFIRIYMNYSKLCPFTTFHLSIYIIATTVIAHEGTQEGATASPTGAVSNVSSSTPKPNQKSLLQPQPTLNPSRSLTHGQCR